MYIPYFDFDDIPIAFVPSITVCQHTKKLDARDFMTTANQSDPIAYIEQARRLSGQIAGSGTEIAARPIASVGIVGAGTMGSGIAINFLNAGLPVTLVEQDATALERGAGTIRNFYRSRVDKGRMSADAAERASGLLQTSLTFDSFAEIDLIIEAVYESFAVKREVFAAIDRAAKPGAILATNTSYLDIDEIAAATTRPHDVVGLHFFSPAQIMKLLEVVKGAATAPDVLVTAVYLGTQIGKIPVISGNCHGFIGNRILQARQREAMNLLLEGVQPDRIDQTHVEFGMPMGPFQMADLAGVDVGWHRDPSRVETIREALCAAGRLGQKAGKGFYDYDANRNRSTSAEAQSIIDGFAGRIGHEPKPMSGQEIIERTIYPMVNEGAKIVEEGIVQRVSDIDVVWTSGYGWPVARGGPMYWGDNEGLQRIVTGLEKHGHAVSPLLAKLARDRKNFIA